MVIFHRYVTVYQRLIPNRLSSKTLQPPKNINISSTKSGVLQPLRFSFGFVLASMVYHVDGAHEVFLLVVALNGLCTGRWPVSDWTPGNYEGKSYPQHPGFLGGNKSRAPLYVCV